MMYRFRSIFAIGLSFFTHDLYRCINRFTKMSLFYPSSLSKMESEPCQEVGMAACCHDTSSPSQESRHTSSKFPENSISIVGGKLHLGNPEGLWNLKHESLWRCYAFECSSHTVHGSEGRSLTRLECYSISSTQIRSLVHLQTTQTLGDQEVRPKAKSKP